MTQYELDKTIQLHQKWLNGDPEGVRANISGANMREANMSEADMSGANMRRADMIGANMREANMRRADMHGADMSYANMCDANMNWADMCRANISNADMRDADISGANIDYVTFTLWCGTLHIRIDNRITSQLLYHVLSCVEVSPDVSDDVKKVLLSPEVVAIANQFHYCKSGELPEIGEYRDDPD